MDRNEKEGKGVKQPKNLVHYKPPEELFTRIHTCIMLRELPEISLEEAREISDREKNLEVKARS